MERWLSTRQVRDLLNVHPNTLRKWADDGKVIAKRSPGKNRLYLYSSLPVAENIPRKAVCYVRVSSPKQKDDLKRQEAYMREIAPDAEIIKDIGSGLNFKRKGLLSLLERVQRKEISRITIAHKDRLCRFGFDFFLAICSFNETEVVVLDHAASSPDQELVKDLCAIIHVFSCRLHGLRRYADRIKEDQDLSNEPETETDP